jgi:hypothetical protein|tara:strand:- start:731 stop:1207 length:477 start_codon:yes stop_codon:yes gene_type:complete
MENLNSLKSAELITLAQAGNESALAEINRRHANRVKKNKKPIPAVAKFLGLAPAKPAKTAKAKPAAPAANDLSDDELVAKYAKSSAAFLKNMLAKVKDERKKTAMLVALNAKTSAGMVSVATPVQPSVAVSKQLAGIIKALDGLSQGDQAMVLAALSA